MKILITGGAGFIGRHLTQLLQTKSHQIVWLDNLDPQIHGDYQHPQDILPHPDIKLIVGNVCDRSAWLQAIECLTNIKNDLDLKSSQISGKPK